MGTKLTGPTYTTYIMLCVANSFLQQLTVKLHREDTEQKHGGAITTTWVTRPSTALPFVYLDINAYCRYASM